MTRRPEHRPSDPAHEARIMLCDVGAGDGLRLAEALGGEGHAVEAYSDADRFLEAAVADPPDLVVYALGTELEADLPVLRLLRRAQPGLKLVLLAQHPSLDARTALQTVQPTFYCVAPFEVEEVASVVRAATRRRPRTS